MDQKSLKKFVLVWALNSFVFYLANLMYPANVVLGNANFGMLMAAVVSGLLLTFVAHIAKGFLLKIKVVGRSRYTMFVFYWFVNAVAIWLIARIAPVSGLGITAFYWAFAIGLFATLAQWLVRQVFKTTKLFSK